ncbi:AAA family ATPase [uncultured Corynebacterium sp.]|uniref:AAA family ATPase n=1 Tax=uncultured Corynebacterium sp. TaxID=159447 RepID=UPI0025FEA0BF|nr:AAA family ATPase [uncultured Corynebacterium sp.]
MVLKIHKIDIRNFCTIDHVTLEFPDTGVTVISGPNEVGKSSIVKALTMWKSASYSSTKAEVKAAKPVDQDVAPEVTVEMTVDGQHFSMFKRWLTSSRAELRVFSPMAKTLTGKEAESWLNHLFASSDQSMPFDALTVSQASGTWDFLDVGNYAALENSLSESDGSDDSDAVGLRGDIKSEFDKYFTSALNPRAGVYKDAISEYEKAKKDEEDVEKAAEKLANLRSELERITHKLDDDKKTIIDVRVLCDRAQNERKKIDEAQAKLKQAQQNQKDAESSLQHQRELKQSRAQLHDDYTERKQQAVKAEEKYNQVAKQAESYEARLKAAQDTYDDAHWVKTCADLELDKLKIHREWAAATKEAEQVRTKLLSGDAANKRRHEAESKLHDGSSIIDDDVFDDLKKSQEAWRNQEEALGLAVGTINIEGPDGDHAVGEYPMDRPQRIELGKYTVEIRPSAEMSDRREDVDSARDAFKGLLKKHELESFDDAEQRHNAYCQAREERDTAQRDQDIAWERQPREALEVKLQELRRSADDCDEQYQELLDREAQSNSSHDSDSVLTTERRAYEVFKAENVPSSEDIRRAKAEKHRAEYAFDVAHRELEKLRQEDVSAQLSCEKANRDSANKERDRALEKLAEAQAALPDEVLANNFHEAEDECDHRRGVYDKAVNNLKALDPEQNTKKLEEAKRRERDLLQAIENSKAEQIHLRGQIEGSGSPDADLQEKKTILKQKENTLKAVKMRANAIRRLYQLVEKHYEDAKKEYLEPYINLLTQKAGRVFGSDVSFTSEDDADGRTTGKKNRGKQAVSASKISQRVLNGRAVNLAELSGGAAEQLQIIQRLAVAELVGDQSVPVFLDDALGYADTERATKMNELLTESGKKHQIIVMTCVPERYKSVHAAKTIEMTGTK